MHGFDHLRKRVRVTKGLEPFPATSVWKIVLDHLMYGVAIFAPLALLPQIKRLYTVQDASGLSALTFTLFIIMHVLWILYGVAHKDRQIVTANFMMMFFNGIVLVGILIF